MSRAAAKLAQELLTTADAARILGQLTFLDTQETLAKFMREGEPDRDHFDLTRPVDVP
jgi:phage protein U